MKRIGEIRDGNQLYVKDWVYEVLEALADSPEPPPPPPDTDEGERALESATVASNSAQDIAGWPVAVDLDHVEVMWNRIRFPYSPTGEWPLYDGSVVGNLWFMAELNGQWHAGTVDWLRPHQKDKTLDVPLEHETTAEALPTFIKAGPLGSYVPKKGDKCGMFVSSIARNGRTTVDERSNVILLDWPY